MKKFVKESEHPEDSGLVLPGWNCAHCLVFNGEEKAPRDECRSCGAPRKSFGLPLERVLQRMRLLEENLSATQNRCSELLKENRALKAAQVATPPDICPECHNYEHAPHCSTRSG